MKHPFRAGLVVIFVLLTISLGWVLVGNRSAQMERRNQKRRQDLVIILDAVEAFARKNSSLPSFPVTYQQIGTDPHNCQLKTAACSIDHDACINVNGVLSHSDITVPSDPSSGNIYKTGYAGYYDSANEVLHLTACYTENGESISVERSLRGIFK